MKRVLAVGLASAGVVGILVLLLARGDSADYSTVAVPAPSRSADAHAAGPDEAVLTDGAAGAPARTAADRPPAQVELARGAPASAERDAPGTDIRPALIVLVTTSAGRPAADAEVLFALHASEPGSGPYRPRRTSSVRADGGGQARVDIPGDESVSWLELWARRPQHGEVSETLLLQTPWPLEQTQHLRLRTAGSLRVQVFEASLVPAAGAEVRVMSVPSLGWLTKHSWWRGKADAGGTYVLPALRPGEYEVSAGDVRIGRFAEQRAQVDWSAESLLELVLSDSDLPLAVEGVLVDEEGRPIADVHVGLTPDPVNADDAASEWWVRTDGAGRFRWFAEPAGEVRVRPRPDDACSRFDPPSVIVPFGTRELRLERSGRISVTTLELHAVDATSGEPVPGAQLWLVHGEDFDEQSSTPAGEDGSARLKLCLRETATWGVHAPGYLPAEGRLSLANLERPLRVELERGFARRLRIVHWYSHVPLPGAVVTDGAGIEAVADAEGFVHLTDALWPGPLTVRHAGFTSGSWDPARRKSWADDYCPLFEPTEK